MLAGDTEPVLAARVLRQEHVIYPLALRHLIETEAGLGSSGCPDPGAALLNPCPPGGSAVEPISDRA